MEAELEAAVADSAGQLTGGKGHGAPTHGATCANCGAQLEGSFCHVCGQNSDTHRRSILHLIWEAIEGLFHLDGRLLRTAPDLFFRPGRLARDYLEGRVARHVPPFRTFLVALLLFIFAAENAIHGLVEADNRQKAAHEASLATPSGRAAEVARLRAKAADDLSDALKEAASDRDDDLKDPDEDRAKIAANYARDNAKAQTEFKAAQAKADAVAAGQPEDAPRAAESPPPRSNKNGDRWWREGTRKAIANPEYYVAVVFTWGHRLAVLLLPIVGLALAAVYRNKPQYFLYDHLLVAMNLLSFAFLTNAIGLVLPVVAAPWWLGLVAIWTPINLFQTLRGAYGSSVLGAALKTLVVWATTVASFGLLLFGLIVFSLGQL